MTTDELLAKGYVRQPDGSFARIVKTGNQGPNPVIQKQQDADSQKSEGQRIASPAAHNQARVSKEDGSNHRQFRITVLVRFPNRRRTDLSGKLDTILDCLTAARRRLLGNHTGDSD